MSLWPVVPICEKQRRDVRPEDLVANGSFRLCNTHRGGGGYDQFPAIFERRFGEAGHELQFVVQLKGCHLACPYCYVTPDGINGEHQLWSSSELVREFGKTDATVFHLMGGAPALYLRAWPELLMELYKRSNKRNWVFHSDLLLTERVFNTRELLEIAWKRCLYAVNVKGVTNEEHLANTGKPLNETTFWYNMVGLEAADVPYYITFTNITPANRNLFWKQYSSIVDSGDRFAMQVRDSFHIDIVQYEALK